jgi:hypothetical protein
LEVSGELHALTALPMGKESLVPMGQEVGSQPGQYGKPKFFTLFPPPPQATKETGGDSLLVDMLLTVVSVLVVAQPSSEFPERLMNQPELHGLLRYENLKFHINPTYITFSYEIMTTTTSQLFSPSN